MNKKIDVWFLPVSTLVIAIINGLNIWLYYHFYLSSYGNKSYELLISFLLSLVATFLGIFIPLWINKNWQKKDERREMVFAMSYVWQELRKNLFVVEQIRVNFTFKLILEQIFAFDELTNMIDAKLSSMRRISQGLSNKYFLSALNSKMFVRIDSDEIFNEVFSAYDNIKTFEVKLFVLCEDLLMKKALLRDPYSKLNQEDMNRFRKTYEEQILSVYSEIIYCKKSLLKTIDLIDNRLDSLSVKAELIERESFLLTKLPDEVIPDNDIVKM